MVEWWSECGANDGRGLGGWKRPDREWWMAADASCVCKRRHNSKPLPSPGSVARRFCASSGDKPAQAGAMQSSRGAGNVMDGHWKPNKTYRICCG